MPHPAPESPRDSSSTGTASDAGSAPAAEPAIESGSTASGPDTTRAAQLMPSIGASVTVSRPLAYLKTAEPRPMLRPPDLIDRGEVGRVVAHHALAQCAVRFRRGTFLIEASDLGLHTGLPPTGAG